MNESHAVQRLAVRANCRLSDSPPVYLNGLRLLADVALEEGHAHLWNERGGADDHPTDGDELVDVFRVQHTHVLCLVSIECTHLWQSVQIYTYIIRK